MNMNGVLTHEYSEEFDSLRKQFEQKKNEVLQSTENMGRQITGK